MIRIGSSEREAAELGELFRGSSDRRVRDRARAALVARRGRPRGQVAADPGVGGRTDRRWPNGWAAGRAGGRAAGRPGWCRRSRRGRRAASPTRPDPTRPDPLAGPMQDWVKAGPAACGLKFASPTGPTRPGPPTWGGCVASA